MIGKLFDLFAVSVIMGFLIYSLVLFVEGLQEGRGHILVSLYNRIDVAGYSVLIATLILVCVILFIRMLMRFKDDG